jgi:hypothetical protein
MQHYIIPMHGTLCFHSEHEDLFRDFSFTTTRSKPCCLERKIPACALTDHSLGTLLIEYLINPFYFRLFFAAYPLFL